MVGVQKLRYVFFFACFLCSRLIFSQTGNYFIHNYSPKDYRSGANNFGITQNDEGYIFIANTNGVNIFDGVSWQQCKRDDELDIYSIAKTEDGQIVVGAKDGDIAVIERGPKGLFRYRSLLKNASPEQKPQEAIRQIIVKGRHTYFLSMDRLVEYTGNSFKYFSPDENFQPRAFVIGEYLCVWDANRGIKALVNGKLEKIPNTDELSGLKFFFSYKINATKYALGSRENGIYYVYADAKDPKRIQFKEVNSPDEEELAQAEVNNGCLLRNGQFVVTTNKKGALLIDSNLRVITRFNVSYGIYDDNIKACYEDLNGNIWLSLYYGVSFIEINSRVRKYDRRNGINGLVQSATFYNNKLYIGTDKGVQYFDSVGQKFLPVPDFNKQTWYLCQFGNKLIIATAKGLFALSGNLMTQLNDVQTKFLVKDAARDNILYCGSDVGLDIYGFSGGNIQPLRSVVLNSGVKSIASNKLGNIALSTEYNGIYLLTNKDSEQLDSVTTQEGLPNATYENYVFAGNEKLFVGTESGIYSINKSSNKYNCLKAPLLWDITKGTEVFRATGAGKDIVCSQKYYDKENEKIMETISYLEYSNGAFSNNRSVTGRLKDLTPTSITFDDGRKSTLVCCNEGLFLIDNNTFVQKKKYHLFIKDLMAEEDTLGLNISLISKDANDFDVPYSKNNIKLTMGFSSYENPASEYSHKLEGRDKDFSKWDKETKIQFSNLPEGNYTIHVRARSEISSEIYDLKIKLRILAPWYRTFWAYIAYVIILIGAIYVIVQLNVRRLKKQNKNLEEVITERTKVIADQKGELENKQKEIIDSIHYAQRIQQALLASNDLLDENLEEYFILFKPKDIVSGDFYWATSTEEGFLFICADCTGHGVPGAFMSLLNISKLNETVTQKGIIRPDLILNEVRNEIILALNPPGSKDESKDGMDAVLCKLDRKNMKLQYAAANNSFYIVRKGEILVCKADKMPVGKGHDNTPYTFNELDLERGDVIYTFTDGYADQFGGPKGKKLMYKKMEELMLKVSPLPMREQNKIMDERFEEWRGMLEQVDDVCIIGVRV